MRTMIMTTTTDTKSAFRTIMARRALTTSVVGLLIVIAASTTASAQTIAGAEPKKEAAPKAAAAAPRHIAKAAAPPAASAPPVLVASNAGPPPSAGAPEGAATSPSGAAPVATSTTMVTVGGSSPANACIPDCRAGFVCREGECVSGCNPQCGESETCNAKRECVPKTDANEPYAYDKTRFAIGGAFGVAPSADGMGTPFGGVIGVGIPLGGHWYSREDIVVTYSKTATEDHYYIGSGVSPNGTTPVDQSYLLVALRATAGYQFSSLVSARGGIFAGSHNLSARHGFCGVGPVQKEDSSFAIGGTGALALAFKHADLGIVVDAYSANTQALCSVVATPFGGVSGQPATLVPQRQVAAQILAQASILF